MRVREFMKTDVITIETDTPIMDALGIMKEKKIKRLPVVKKGKLVGLVTRAMLRDASPSKATSLSIHELNYLLAKMTVSDIMVKDPVTISPDLPVEEAIWLGKERGIGAFPVTEGDRLVGIITESDIAGVVINALGVGETDSRRISIEASGPRFGFLRGLVDIVDNHKVPIMSIVTVPGPDPSQWSLILRLGAKDADQVVSDLKKNGYSVKDVT